MAVISVSAPAFKDFKDSDSLVIRSERDVCRVRPSGAGTEKETRRKKKRFFLCYLCDCAPQRREMGLLHSGNGLMGKIREENGSGNQNKSMWMELKETRQE